MKFKEIPYRDRAVEWIIYQQLDDGSIKYLCHGHGLKTYKYDEWEVISDKFIKVYPDGFWVNHKVILKEAK